MKNYQANRGSRPQFNAQSTRPTLAKPSQATEKAPSPGPHSVESRHQAPPEINPLKNIRDFVGNVAQFIGRQEAATSAVLIGATAAPLFTGVSAEVLAKQMPTSSAAKDANPEIVIPNLNTTRRGPPISFEQAQVSIDQTGPMFLRKFDASSIRIKGLHEAILRAKLDRAGISDTDSKKEYTEDDRKVFDHVLNRIEGLAHFDGNISPRLIADLDGLVGRILDAPEGKVKDVFNRSIDLGTFSVDAPEIITNTPELDTTATAFRRYFSFDYGRVRNVASDVANAYNLVAENTVDRLPALPDVSWRFSRDVSWADNNGNRFIVPAGSRVDVKNDKVSILGKGLLVEVDGTRFRMEEGRIRFGNGKEHIGAGVLEYADNNNHALFEGLSATSNREASKYTLSAKRGEIDVDAGTLRLGRTKLKVRGNGNLRGTVRDLDLNTNDVSITADKLVYSLRERRNDSNELALKASNAVIGTSDFNASVDEGVIKFRRHSDGSTRISGDFQDLNTRLGGTTINTDGRTNLKIHANANGEFTRASITSDVASLTSNGERLDVTAGSLNITVDELGRIDSARGTGDKVSFRTNSDETFRARNGFINTSFFEDGQLKKVSGNATRASYEGKNGTFIAHDSDLKARFSADGNIMALEGSGDAQWRGSNGNIIAARGSTLDLKFTETNTLLRANFSGESLKATLPGGETVSAENTSGNVLFDRNGLLREVSTSSGKVHYADENRDRTASADGLNAKIKLSSDGQLKKATLTSGDFKYTGDNSDFKSTGKTEITSAYDNSGALKRLNVTSDAISFSRDSENDHKLAVDMKNVRFNTVKKSHGYSTSVSGRDGNVRFDGHEVDMGSASTLEIKSNRDGMVNKFDAKFPDKVSFEHRDGKLAVRLSDLNVNANRTRNETKLRATFAEGHIALKSDGLTANIKDAGLKLTDGQVRMHVSRAEVLKSIGERFNVNVEGLDLVADYSDDTVRGLDIKVAGVEGKIKDMNFWVRSDNGDRVRLNLSADADGNAIKRAFLKIPDGGEVEVNHEDFNVNLGPQTLKFTNTSGEYRLRGRNLNISAATSDAKVKVAGGTANIAINKNTGELIINRITGTDINLKMGGTNVDINLEDLNGYLTRVTGASNGTQGASIHFIPTNDNSRFNMEVKTNLSGIPVKLSVDDAHELTSFARLSENEARFYVGDSSGRGEVHLSSGPLNLRGSAIELIAKYEAYDTNRMSSILGRLFTTDGFNITRNLVVEPDGVVRLGTVDSPVVAEVSVLLPKGTGSTPAYVFDVGDGASDGTIGAVGRLGVRGTSTKNADYSGSIFVGAVPASYLEVSQPQGSATLFGVPMPKTLRAPTTGMAGVTLERKTDDLNLRLDVGGFVNPASLAPSSVPLSESTVGGFFTGLRAEKENLEVGADAIFEVDNGGNTKFGGARVTFGFRF